MSLPKKKKQNSKEISLFLSDFQSLNLSEMLLDLKFYFLKGLIVNPTLKNSLIIPLWEFKEISIATSFANEHMISAGLIFVFLFLKWNIKKFETALCSF